ncbi:MAG: heme exporter protein CcmD [Roseinatronobacter sp.]|uniref:Heme exporter protein D n=1 Tax=Roseinatronobacter monicus TaxID=393481 RepID=A0A543KDD8_9RHOB|nr:heme exporter protein CcmD [Roseinatronobacter monicus]TQM93105.1 heme exporter protein D [Roseinatronobacter monicus]TVP97459.1 MAG: heme exporter protein CcmD [Roseinatronobacter sp.]
MMPDLGRYALEVSLAYLVSLGLIGVLVLWYWVRGRSVRRQLNEIESRRGENG